MMRQVLTKEQIKAIADRAEGKEPEFVLRTFVCKQCGHEIVVNPKHPKYETPVICTPCWEFMQGQKKAREEKPFDPDKAIALLGEVLKLTDRIEKLTDGDKQ